MKRSTIHDNYVKHLEAFCLYSSCEFGLNIWRIFIFPIWDYKIPCFQTAKQSTNQYLKHLNFDMDHKVQFPDVIYYFPCVFFCNIVGANGNATQPACIYLYLYIYIYTQSICMYIHYIPSSGSSDRIDFMRWDDID